MTDENPFAPPTPRAAVPSANEPRTPAADSAPAPGAAPAAGPEDQRPQPVAAEDQATERLPQRPGEQPTAQLPASGFLTTVAAPSLAGAGAGDPHGPHSSTHPAPHGTDPHGSTSHGTTSHGTTTRRGRLGARAVSAVVVLGLLAGAGGGVAASATTWLFVRM
jgi:putative serine protease PepD